MRLFSRLRDGRKRDRIARQLVRDREKLAALAISGSAERPMPVASASVVEVRANALACPQCDGHYKVGEHTAHGPGLRRVRVTCARCHVPRELWFRLVSTDPS